MSDLKKNAAGTLLLRERHRRNHGATNAVQVFAIVSGEIYCGIFLFLSILWLIRNALTFLN